jgi:hypothetical protein
MFKFNHRILVFQTFTEQGGKFTEHSVLFLYIFSVCIESEIFRLSSPVKLFLNADKLITNSIVRAS